MSNKNNVSSGFRKIDIDSYNDDVFKDDDQILSQSSATSLDDKEILQLCSSGKHYEAIRSIFDLQPQTSGDPLTKDLAFNLIMQVFLAVKTGDIDKIVDKLDTDQIDLLMKYVYKGFENPQEGSSSNLLVWHDKIFRKSGHGSIVRVLTDKKKV
ncbi:actin-related protein 2/3 complex subunit 5-B-like [Panonychus citri]|uniref:actin-related protein 2/3 complex subunit 5-B-like n=1 Tax=Panonychus citri TaxID=50023 RepID=UPI002307A7BE|nr:actin-related protein 2/3 complex subunit 5-B-like [Panonychus citri]XP_053211713.1 actin-related protein 2/3 complex subunit 5-B-like [Panonychus citri]